MIITAEIKEPPVSGTYPEKIYDADCSTEEWAWVKFETELYETFYGEFKGKPIQVAISPNNVYCYVLTETLLYEINRENPDQFSVQDYYNAGPSIRSITLTPNGKLLLCAYYTIFSINQPLCQLSNTLVDALIELENSLSLEYIEFKNWQGSTLLIHAKDFWTGQSIELSFNYLTNQFQKI